MGATARRLSFLLAAVVSAAAVSLAAAAAQRASLKITYWAHGSASAPVVWTLRCGPAGGTHPARRAACAALAAHPSDLRPATRACPILSTRTSARATISGAWRGTRVKRGYRIGCPGWADLRVVLTGK